MCLAERLLFPCRNDMLTRHFTPSRYTLPPLVSSLTTPFRFFCQSPTLYAKRRPSEKQRAHAKRKQHSTPHAASQAQHRTPTPRVLSDRPTPCTASIEEREKELLRYFGRARHHYDVVPLHEASAALQGASRAQACRVPFATLFPAPVGSASALRSSNEHPTEANDDGDDGTPSHAKAALLVEDAAAASATDLFVGYSKALSNVSDFHMSRSLSSRLNSSVDGNKEFGTREVPLRDIAVDSSHLWSSLCGSWESVVDHCASCKPPLWVPSAQSVCFVVCFAQTMQTYTVGNSFRAMAAEAVRLCRTSRSAKAASVFAVVPVYVGVEPTTAAAAVRVGQNLSPEVEDGHAGRCSGGIAYPTGGLYTCAALTQCLSRFAPHTRASTATAGSHTLTPQVFLVSDAWLNARSVADLCSKRVQPSTRQVQTTKRAASSADNRSQRPLSFIPEASRRRVHVFPGVISQPLSERERCAFGTSLWSTMERVCSGENKSSS